MARPYEKLPRGARSHLEAMAENGLLSELKAATALGMPLRDFRRCIAEDEQSRTIWLDALAIERDKLLEQLYTAARNGDGKAATSLLAIRHGLTERQPQGNDKGVHVTFNLPSSLDNERYLRAIESIQPQGALPDATT
ncbi:hypothetical protein [Nitrosomonas sp.]|uniref:hypothetical protein n=1 Tax=Nitrosomonas sp. TaxID=42353 RepID=UPI00260B8946|nr:hypothetical protein [Nitrosomonas sp.]MCW5601814.1 hypothetical protein [Nitrosomonas sp.]